MVERERGGMRWCCSQTDGSGFQRLRSPEANARGKRERGHGLGKGRTGPVTRNHQPGQGPRDPPRGGREGRKAPK